MVESTEPEFTPSESAEDAKGIPCARCLCKQCMLYCNDDTSDKGEPE